MSSNTILEVGADIGEARRVGVNTALHYAPGFKPAARTYFCAPIQDRIGILRLLHLTQTTTLCPKRSSYTISFCFSRAMGSKF